MKNRGKRARRGSPTNSTVSSDTDTGNYEKEAGEPTEKIKTVSKTLRELRLVTREMATSAVLKALQENIPDPSKKNYQSTEVGWAAAVTMPSGCIVCQKKPSRKVVCFYPSHFLVDSLSNFTLIVGVFWVRPSQDRLSQAFAGPKWCQKITLCGAKSSQIGGDSLWGKNYLIQQLITLVIC